MRALFLALALLLGAVVWGTGLWTGTLPLRVTVGVEMRGRVATQAAPVPYTVRSQAGAAQLRLPGVLQGARELCATITTPFDGVEALALGDATQWDRFGELVAGQRVCQGLPAPRGPDLLLTALGGHFRAQGEVSITLEPRAPDGAPGGLSGAAPSALLPLQR